MHVHTTQASTYNRRAFVKPPLAGLTVANHILCHKIKFYDKFMSRSSEVQVEKLKDSKEFPVQRSSYDLP